MSAAGEQRKKQMMMRGSQLTFHTEAILNCLCVKLPEELTGSHI